jgi:hypothetical protein
MFVAAWTFLAPEYSVEPLKLVTVDSPEGIQHFADHLEGLLASKVKSSVADVAAHHTAVLENPFAAAIQAMCDLVR